MVKFLIGLFFVFYSFTARAEYIAGVSTYSWQELIPVIIQNVQSDALSSFSSLGVSLGYQYTYSNRIHAISSIGLLAGSIDVHKQTNAIAPRKNFNSFWFSNKLIWRATKTFSYGPNLVLNSLTISGSSSALNYGFFVDLDYEIFEEIRLTQSLGTMGNSQQLAYSISLNRLF